MFKLPLVNCGSNSLLDSVKQKTSDLKDVLSGSVAEIQSGLTSAMNGLKDSLTGLKPKTPPIVRDFKAELIALSGKTGVALAKARDALREAWGGAVSDLETLMDKASNPLSGFSICKDAPSVSGTVQPDGSIQVEQKAQESATPVAAPAKAEAAPRTSTVKTRQQSSSGSGLAYQEAQNAYRIYESEKAEALRPIAEQARSTVMTTYQLFRDPDVKAALGTNESASSQFDTSPAIRLRKGTISQAQYNKWVTFERSRIQAATLRGVIVDLEKCYVAWENFYQFGNTPIDTPRRAVSDTKKLHRGYESEFDAPEIITSRNEKALKDYAVTLRI